MAMVGRETLSFEQVCNQLHKIAGVLLRSAGFRLALRGSTAQENGPKIGIWHKALTASPRERPRRFALIPGFGDSPVSWLPVLSLLRRALHRHYDELVLIEFPGYHGYLFNERCFPSLDSLLDVLLGTMDELQPHTTLGHSLGGGLAAYHAGMRGKQGIGTSTERLLLISPSGVFTDYELQKQTEARIQRIVENGVECIPEIPGWLRRLVSEFLEFSSKDDIRQFVHSFRDDHKVEPLLPYIRAHVELIWGTQDSLVPPTVAPIWLKGMTGARSEATFLEGIGHAPQLESPKLLARTLDPLFDLA